MTGYPRTRAETGEALVEEHDLKELLSARWGIEATAVDRSDISRCVFFCQSDDRPRFVFRCNPGWDGPTPPPTVVQFIDHLARCGAPCPQIFPTKEDELSFAHEDFTLSVESFLQGECSDRTDHLFNVGTALGRIHDAAESFSEFPPATRPVKDYVNPILRESTSLNLRSDFAEAAAHLSDLIRTRLAAAGSTRVLWILCRGDVRSRNTIAHRDDSVSFTDFGSAHFAPALTDVAMVQPQWLMGTTQRPLTEDEVTSYVHGYVEARASGLQDLTALPVIWAAHYLSRLCFLHSKWRLDQPGKTRWNGDDRVVTLPFDGVEMMEEAVQEVSS